MSSPSPRPTVKPISYVWVSLLILAALVTLTAGIAVLLTKHSQNPTTLDNLGLYSGIMATTFIQFAGGRVQRHQQMKPLYYVGLGIFGAAILVFIATNFV